MSMPEERDLTPEEQERLMALYAQVAAENGIVASTWSIYEVDDFKAEHPFPGVVTLVYDGDHGRREYPIQGRTWLDLWKVADKAVANDGPTDHVYVEQFTKKGPGLLWLWTGS